MILAHVTDSGGGGGGGGSPLRWVLLILAVAAIATAGRLRTGNRPTVQWLALGALGAALAIGGVAWPLPEQDPIYLTVLTPDDGSIVTANQPVPITVRVEGGTIAGSDTDLSGGHLHLYIDGRLETMLYTDQPTVTLPPGIHKLKVEYTDEKHQAYDPPVEVEITLDAQLPPGTP